MASEQGGVAPVSTGRVLGRATPSRTTPTGNRKRHAPVSEQIVQGMLTGQVAVDSMDKPEDDEGSA